MKKLILSQDIDTKLFEYLMLISPSEEVSRKVSEVKSIFSETYGCKHAAQLVPHLTMINFLQQESAEFRLINCFEKFTQYVAPFSIELNGFGEFAPHTIYLKLAETQPVIDLVKDLRSKFQRILKISEQLKPNYTLKPHLTIARQLTPEQFETIWPTYKKEHFSESFLAKEMILIRREVDPFTRKSTGKYKIVHHFPFLGKQREAQLAMAF
ncbi:MAG: 2'-5' RNA ligase family protein [Pedobacter sp.]|nr:2'-5' RNA ligase family protein [Pedobacter sp.]MDQ8054346.1 2'-5' RNA ligase family protein [Pedobacter sp.]